MKKAAGLMALLAAAMLFMPGAARADTAPLRAVGTGLQPVAETRVQMEAERIEIRVSRKESEPGRFGLERVAHARVWFRFATPADERIEVGFPLFLPDPVYDWQNTSPLQEFRVTVDGRPVETVERDVLWKGKPARWAVWSQEFRKGTPLEMEVSYQFDVSPAGKGWGADLMITYILETGAFWAGPIGRADAIIAFDRPIRAEDVVLRMTTPGWRLENGALHWTWTDLEPDFNLDLRIADLFYYGLPDDLAAIAARSPLSEADLQRLYTGTTLLLEGDGRSGLWVELRNGVLSGEAAEPLVPVLLRELERAMAARPHDQGLREQWLRLLLRSSGRLHEDMKFRLYHPERFRAYMAAARGTGLERDERHWSYLTVSLYTDHPELREGLLGFLLERLPTTFPSEEAARNRVHLLLNTNGREHMESLAPGLWDQVWSVAAARVKPTAPASPAEPAPVSPLPAAPGAPEPEPQATSENRGWLALLLLTAAGVALGGALWRKRRGAA